MPKSSQNRNVIIPKEFEVDAKEFEVAPVVLITCDGKEFEVDEVVVMNSLILKESYGPDRPLCGFPVELYEVSSEILPIVIDYCKKLADETAYEDLKAEFLKLEPRILCGLIIAAHYMFIRSLLDLSSQVVVEIINDLNPEEIYKTLEIDDDFTTKEAEDLYLSEPWLFKENSSTVTHLTFEQQRKMDRESFLQKILPVCSVTAFRYLTPQDKRKWVLAAVMIPQIRRFIDSLSREDEFFHLKSKSSGKKKSESVDVDLSNLFAEDLNLNVNSKDNKIKKKWKNKKKFVT